MFQIKPTKSIKPSRSNRTAIGRKTDPNWYASVLIITKPISIGSVTNLKKYRANRTVHTPSSRVAAPTSDSSDTASGVQCVKSPFFFSFQFTPIPAETRVETVLFQPKQPSNQTDMTAEIG